MENSELLIVDNNKKVTISKGETVSLLLTKFPDEFSLEINIDEGANLKLSIIADHQISNGKINVNIEKDTSFEAYFADFSSISNILEVNINLIGKNANAVWHTASLADKKDKKNISVSISHKVQETYGKVDNYGVCKNEAKLMFAGTSHIVNGAIKSKTQQNAKIMVFDKTSDAIAKPILRIDENDIEANHAAAVGKISDEHLFYLTSRGISLEEARTLITLGYLKPIFKGFNEKEVEYINSLIGGRL